MCGGGQDACLLPKARLKRAERSGHGRWRRTTPLRGSVECVKARANPEPRPGMPGARILPLKGVGKRNAAAALGLVLFSHHARTTKLACRLGAKLAHQGPILGALALPHDDRAVIEIQILTRSCKPSLIRHARSIQEAGRTNDASPSRKPRMNHFIRGQHHRQAPRRPRSSDLPEARADPVTAPAVEEQQGRQCLTMRGDRNLALVRQPGQKY